MDSDKTMKFEPPKEKSVVITGIIKSVCEALEKKGYDPKNQIIGYILSGDPSYITSHDNARNLIRQIDRDELLEELLDVFIQERIK